MDDIRKNALLTLEKTDEYRSAVVKRTLKERSDWDHRDGAFYTALVETETAHQSTIDAVIAAYSSTRLKKIDRLVLSAIRLALAQIFFMEKVPDAAACNESVGLIKSLGRPRFASFANAVIRQVIREKDAPEARVVLESTSIRLKYSAGHWRVLDKRYASFEPLLDKSLRYSYPYWITEFLEKSYPGKSVTEGLSAERKITAISKAGADVIGDSVSDSYELPGGLFELTFKSGTNPASLSAFKDGIFYIMDRSSMQPLLNAGLESGASVLDLCASPGGKSVCAAWLYGARVTSCDVSRQKTERIEENISRLGLNDRISATVNDATEFRAEWETSYDCVIADCPCSGLGVSGRKPEIRLRLLQSDFAELAAIQRKILENAARYVKPGGKLIYSTCTLDPAENEEQTDAFISAHPEFFIQKQLTIIPDAEHDGFFYSIIRKKQA
ncbi:MAG: methyltransferase domain-containing protein [Lachnospiraceae bacterium]|uniref:Methyltransferase domain-containing protein n=1 Tax=Candidatus Weimeria bifida TaxID=2599074 RepID=A0A6N7IZ42_9FIRM|nr:methyltransferase domain-containing protein [Candidatus Weimeria bifida]RRF96668.1 MAG: methyltransferase domain-containing protein [Lachnospiraceae bacterium]